MTSEQFATPVTSGNYMSRCSDCQRPMQFSDKRCITCTDCVKPQESVTLDPQCIFRSGCVAKDRCVAEQRCCGNEAEVHRAAIERNGGIFPDSSPSNSLLKPEKIAEYREIQRLGPFAGIGGKLLGELLDEIERLQTENLEVRKDRHAKANLIVRQQFELADARKAVDDLTRHHLKAHNVPTVETVPQSSKTDLSKLYDAFGIGRDVRTLDVLLANIENARRRSDCLSAVERQFFTRTAEDEDGEPFDECPLSWGAESAEYVEQFRQALANLRPAAETPAAPPRPEESWAGPVEVSDDGAPFECVMRFKTNGEAVAMLDYVAAAIEQWPPVKSAETEALAAAERLAAIALKGAGIHAERVVDQSRTIKSLCDRLDRIHKVTCDAKRDSEERLTEIAQWSGGFMPAPTEKSSTVVPASEAYSGGKPDLSRDRGPPGPGEVFTSPVKSATSQPGISLTITCRCGARTTRPPDLGVEERNSPIAGWYCSSETGWLCPSCKSAYRGLSQNGEGSL